MVYESSSDVRKLPCAVYLEYADEIKLIGRYHGCAIGISRETFTMNHHRRRGKRDRKDDEGPDPSLYARVFKSNEQI